MKSPRLSLWLAASLSLLLVCPLTAQDDGLRPLEFETTEVTDGGVALSPDGKWLILTILGHLFRLPAGGGDAEQLTFGPYYHMDPAVSPDGSRVVRPSIALSRSAVPLAGATSVPTMIPCRLSMRTLAW